MARKRSISVRTSFRVLPFISSVSMEAEAWLMEQPLPLNLTSTTRPPATSAWIRITSPQTGLDSSRSITGCSNRPLLRGRALWSMITSW